jgi:DNA end-binding protein Ku
MRAIWSGSISWRLVNIPITLYSAVESTRADFRMLCKEHHAPIHYKRVCEEGGEGIPNDTLSGLELGKDEYFILSRDELDRLKTRGHGKFRDQRICG